VDTAIVWILVMLNLVEQVYISNFKIDSLDSIKKVEELIRINSLDNYKYMYCIIAIILFFENFPGTTNARMT
jgi:hypothetical protein